ncbi:single-stranded-DNA-specific exonuclease RecJ [Paucilactobacillus hokkaidonensis JCM 18461]|uniref:Single-stranded-DNA-specific exonuclease RecJ n=1 Tax=Paucilactobacillus hokkaidonensis JCM 18461 TaxID=1291742 RepID=A0A0A1GY35_9LACO|nr:single-stranded-DNA-specific exonuclease RecJ [Paucilactobacillus hokkaidonensis]BAP85848.1 single-stranded-DNA-specific exonuclease RecJ [Paucilactobacillus hokkaidonensis JCM 18461]
MIQSHYQWQLADTDDSKLATQLAQEFDLAPVVAQILISRGYDSSEQVDRFLHPKLEDANDPFLLHDMKKAVERIQTAVESGDLITVYGDYDADGITSTAVMYEALLTVGANANYYVPNRFSDGYGPNTDAFNRLIDAGTQLIVTVDNGVSGNTAIAAANERNIDVVVTDHHELPQELPAAYAIVHPRYPGTDYPFGDLSGVGVAFKVAWALLDELPVELLDLVAIGEVADLVSVTGENRILISAGLQQLRTGSRAGLHELTKAAGLNETELNETNIGFGIAPRLNALGRMGDANPGVELLTTLDDEVAIDLAKQVEQKNNDRQKLVADITQEALEQAADEDNLNRQTLVVAGQNWHEGVLGIVASRLVEQTGKPTLALNINAESGLAKGSGRSIEAFDLFTAIDQKRALTAAFGGHKMAVGLTVPVDNIEALKDQLETAAKQQQLSTHDKQVLQITAQIPVEEANLELFHQIEQLAPFGANNLRPTFEIKSDQIQNVKTMGKTNAHLKFQLAGQGQALTAIAFNQGGAAEQLNAGDTSLAVVGTLDENEWRGNHSIQLMVKDFKMAGMQIVDCRTNNLAGHLFEADDLYLFFDHQLAKKLGKYTATKRILLADELQANELVDQTVTIVDCPPTLDDFLNIFKMSGQPSVIKMLLYQAHSTYLSGMPGRKDFATLYKFTQTHQNINVHDQFDLLVKYLKIDRDQLIFMIQVFSEVGFVKIDHGILNGVVNPPAADLETTKIYQQRQQMMTTEKTLIYSDSTTMRSWLIDSLSAD